MILPTTAHCTGSGTAVVEWALSCERHPSQITAVHTCLSQRTTHASLHRLVTVFRPHHFAALSSTDRSFYICLFHWIQSQCHICSIATPLHLLVTSGIN